MRGDEDNAIGRLQTVAVIDGASASA